MLTPPLDRIDDEIYEETFPELAENDHAKLVKLDEEGMKNPEGKERWRVFIESCVFLSPPPPSFRFSWAAPSPAPSLCIPSSPSVHPCRAPAPPSPYRVRRTR
jgi:hypothetical protein